MDDDFNLQTPMQRVTAGMHSACSHDIQIKDRKEKRNTYTHLFQIPHQILIFAARPFLKHLAERNMPAPSSSWLPMRKDRLSPGGPFSPEHCDVI